MTVSPWCPTSPRSFLGRRQQRDRSRYLHSQSSNLSRPRNRHLTSCHSLFVFFFFPFFFVFLNATRSRLTEETCRRSCGTSRSPRTSCSPCSACTRFDYRSRFEDRLIASSVDEEAEKEVGGRAASCRPPLQQPRVVSRQDSTRWIPGMAAPDAIGYDRESRGAVGKKLCVFHALFCNANKFS